MTHFYKPKQNQKCVSYNCDKPSDYKKEIGTYLHHKKVIMNIENFMEESDIKNLYTESVMNDAFNILDMKKILSTYGELDIDTWIVYGSGLTKQLEIQMVQYYEQLMLTLKGKNIKEVIKDIEIRIKNCGYGFYGERGYYGHRVHASHVCLPYGWTIRPEFYDKVKLDSIEKLALCISKQEITIDEIPSS